MPFLVFPVIAEGIAEPRFSLKDSVPGAYSFYVNNMFRSRVRRFHSIHTRTHLRLFEAWGGSTCEK